MSSCRAWGSRFRSRPQWVSAPSHPDPERRAEADVAEFNYALKSYARSRDKNLARLSEYARAMNMESRVWDIMGVLL